MATANIYDLADTWTVGATTYTAIKMNVTDTASAAASLLLDLQVGGASRFKVAKSGTLTLAGASGGGSTLILATGDAGTANNAALLQINANSSIYGYFGYNSGGGGNFGIFDGGGATSLVYEASHVWAQRNSTNSQTFRVYNTYTDGSNYERGMFDWSTSSNRLSIGSARAGTGSLRSVDFYGEDFSFIIGGSATKWYLTEAGFFPNNDNSEDIGTSSNRPRNLYMGNGIFFPEVSDIAAPSANTGVIYMRDNGSGKTQFVARFPSGAVQVIATEP